MSAPEWHPLETSVDGGDPPLLELPAVGIGPRHPQGFLARSRCLPTTTTTTPRLGMKSVSVRSARLTGGGAQQRPVGILRRDGRLDAAPVGVSLAVS